MPEMSSARAHAWLFVGFVNEHLFDVWAGDEWDGQPEGRATTYCPDCCGPCAAFRDYWNTPRGRAEVQDYMTYLPLGGQSWTWVSDGLIDWAQLQQFADAGWCPNHEGEHV